MSKKLSVHWIEGTYSYIIFFIVNYFICIAILSLAWVGCQKDNSTTFDKSQIDIAVNTPQNGQVFYSGDTVNVTAIIKYQGQLHGYEVRIIDSASDFILFNAANQQHTDKFVVSEKWFNELTSPTSLRVVIIAYVDHNGNTVQQERYINVK